MVLAIDTPYSKERGNSAETAAKAILESRGSVPRIYCNTLVVPGRGQDGGCRTLDEAVRRYLAWESILGEREPLDLSPYQVKQAEIQKEAAASAVTARLPEAYQWLLVPGQARPDSPIEWLAMRLSGQDSLAPRASKKLKGDELLVTGFAASRLRMELDRVPLWRGDHVPIKQIVEDFARYLYLPRVGDPLVLLKSMSDGVALLTWEHDAFAYADSFDPEATRYRGLRGGQLVSLPDADAPRVARQAGCRATTARCRETRTCWRRGWCNSGWREPALWRRTGTRNASTGHPADGDSACAVPWDGAS